MDETNRPNAEQSDYDEQLSHQDNKIIDEKAPYWKRIETKNGAPRLSGFEIRETRTDSL